MSKYIGAVFKIRDSNQTIDDTVIVNIYNRTKNIMVKTNEAIVIPNDFYTMTVPNMGKEHVIQFLVDEDCEYDIDIKASNGEIHFKHFFSKIIESDTDIVTNLVIRDSIQLYDKQNDLLYVKQIDEDVSAIEFSEVYWGDGSTTIFSFNAEDKKAKTFVSVSVNGGLSWFFPSDSWALTYGSNAPDYDDKVITNGHFAVNLRSSPADGEKVIIKWIPYCDTVSIFESINKKITDYGLEVY